MDLGVSGLASGFDWRSLVDQLADVERLPQQRLRQEQNGLAQRNNAYNSIVTQLNVLRNRITTLKSLDLFNGRTVSVGDSTIASASVAAGAVQGTYTFRFEQLATASRRVGTTNVGRSLNASSDVSTLALKDAGFPVAVTAGTFTVNGRQITISGTEMTLQAVFDAIRQQTGDDVVGSYDPGTDTITLTSQGGQEIVLGSATDTSNFLAAARLRNEGDTSVSSTSALGSVRQNAALSVANLATDLVVGTHPDGLGHFKINGVEITYALTDSLSTVINRINDSSAGVMASYDSTNDQLVLASKVTGDIGIALEDTNGGNFLAATGLLGGASRLERGRDLVYTINGGSQLTSHSNRVTGDVSGVSGLTVTALKEGGATTVTVGTDAAGIKTAINDFITEYNKVQSMIETETASSTDGKGKVTAGLLANENEAAEIAGRLRSLVYTQISGLSGAIKHLENLGIKSSGYDNSLKLEDSAKLDTALATNLAAVRDLFSNETHGIAVQVDAYLERTVGDEGNLTAHQSNLTKQAAAIDTQIEEYERIVQANRERMIASFVAMEQAQAQMNQQLQFLLQRFGGTTQ